MNSQSETAPKHFFGRKFLLSFGFIIISIIYVLWQRFGGSPATTVTSSKTASPGQSYKEANTALLQTLSQLGGPGATPTPAAQPTKSQALPVTTTPVRTPTPAPVPQKPAGQYTNGSYTGDATDAYYGTVQVKVIVQGNRISDVQFLQYPSDRSTSQYINSQAMPLLTQEAIQAQSAQVDGVSGATFTSQAFQQSLASALVKAKI